MGDGRSLDLRDSAATLRLCHGCYHEIWRDSTVVTGLLACTKSYSDFVLPITISDSLLVIPDSRLRELPNLETHHVTVIAPSSREVRDVPVKRKSLQTEA
jgi:hypothetical protein